MKIALFGATGKTGRLVLDRLLSQGHVMTIIRQLLLNNVYADALESDAIIRRTDHEWTIVRPYRMTAGQSTRKYLISTEPFPSPVFIRLTSRGDVADFMARVTQDGTYPRQIAYVSTRGI